jgi:hypothetical protein
MAMPYKEPIGLKKLNNMASGSLLGIADLGRRPSKILDSSS